MKPVLFATGLGKEIIRAENLNVLFDAYKGDKVFMSMHDPSFQDEAISRKYYLLVTDIFPTSHFEVGKTMMIWHAIQGGKYIGLDDKRTYYREEFAKNMDMIVTAGRGGSLMFNRCTHVPLDRIVALGMPRTDRYIGKKKGDGGTVMADKRGYMYAPTFRDWEDTPFPVIDWHWLDEQLTDDEIMVVKSHPYGRSVGLNNLKHIVEASRMEPSVNYLYDADVVITDYSSIIFDGYLLDKPAVLFEKNQGYTETRGMYLDYPKQYCSRYARNEQELLDLMRSADKLTDTEFACIDYVANACDGHSCERIVKLIYEMNGGSDNG